MACPRSTARRARITSRTTGRTAAWRSPMRRSRSSGARCPTAPRFRSSRSRKLARVPRVEITYCPRCRWLLRAAWMTQELLTTFERELTEVALRPGPEGIFEITLDGETIWSRAAEGRFPELKELKQRVRDRIAPDRTLGHSDR